MKRSRRKVASSRAVARPTESEFPSRLRSAREERRLSQTELERIAGISQAVIANYEAGRYRPGFREMLKLCDALRVTPSMFFYGTDDPFSQRDIAKGDVGAGFQLWESGGPSVAQLVSIIRGTAYLTALEPSDRQALFAVIQSLVRKRLKPNELKRLEQIIDKLAPALAEATPVFEHEAEIMASHPDLKPFARKAAAPRRHK